jgi:hypothetical protein
LCLLWGGVEDMHQVGRDQRRGQSFLGGEGGVCQYIRIIQEVVAAMTVAGPLDMVKAGLYDQMKAEGIWGR